MSRLALKFRWLFNRLRIKAAQQRQEPQGESCAHAKAQALHLLFKRAA